MKMVGELDAGNAHVQFDKGAQGIAARLAFLWCWWQYDPAFQKRNLELLALGCAWGRRKRRIRPAQG
jgi:hypothetical protein